MGVLEDKARARTFYRYLSRVYDEVNPAVWTEAMRDEAIGMLDLSPSDRVLDVGCGTGFATEGLLEHVGDVHGLDQSVHQLRRAWTKLGKRGPVQFTRGDAERLPYATDSVDVVWSSGSIEYWPNPVDALTEFHRVTRPGGEVLVVGPAAPENRLLRTVADAVMLFYDEREAESMVRAAGLESVEHRVLRATALSPGAIVTHTRVPEE